MSKDISTMLPNNLSSGSPDSGSGFQQEIVIIRDHIYSLITEETHLECPLTLYVPNIMKME